MSKLKLQAAQELIKEGNADAARMVLHTMPENDTAQRWLEKLGQPRKKRSIVGIVVVLLAVVVTGIAAFVGGRQSVYMEIANAFGQAFSSNVPTPDPTSLGGINNPLPSTETAWTDTYGIRVVSLEIPTTIELAGTFGDIMEPAEGAVFAGLMMEFYCPETELTCYTSSGDPNLVLEDGRIAYPLSSVYADVSERDEQIIGGASARVWRFYQIPAAAQPQMLQIGLGSTAVYIAVST